MERIERLDEELVAAKGIIYLMFVGRNIKAYAIIKELVETGIVTDDSVVYQYVNVLQRRGYIKKVEEKNGPGSPRIRTANLEPIFETVGLSRRLVEGLLYSTNQYSTKHKEKKGLEFLFKNIGGMIDFFPKYLFLRLGEERAFRKLRWRETLYYFFHFCIDTITECNMRNKTHVEAGDRYEEVPRKFGSGLKRIIMMANNVDEAIQTKKLSERELEALASLTMEGYGDIYRRGTFLNSLYLMAFSLINPEAAQFIDDLQARLTPKP